MKSNGPVNVEVETLRKQLNEERLRSNDISRDNSKLANRNTNFEKEIAQMQRDLDRQREERHKMQNEIDVARANTKVIIHVVINNHLFQVGSRRGKTQRNTKRQFGYAR